MKRMRHIDLPGCFNLRDVGGYPTRNGASVVWRRLYRSGELSRINSQSAEQLVGARGIRQIIDLRTPAEVQDSVSSLPHPCRYVNLPLLDSFRPHWIRPADQQPEATASRYMEMLEVGLPILVRILSRLREAPTNPTVIHCAVGRDRTGIVVAMVLDLLGVPDAVIAEDYALSDTVIHDGERAQAETIHCLLDLVRSRHRSTRKMLLGAGLSATVIEEVQAALVVPSVGPRRRPSTATPAA